MVAMIVALTNIRLYPPTSAVVEKSIDNADSVLQEILAKETSLIFADSGNYLVISGQLVGEKDRKITKVAAFFELMLNFGIKTLSFNRGLKKSELATFLTIFSEHPDNFGTERKIGQVLSDHRLPHIRIEEKIYVPLGKDQQLLAELDIRDNDIVQFLAGNKPGTTEDKDRIKEMAGDAGWVSSVFSSGLKKMIEERRDISPKKLSEKFGHMVRTLEDISAHADKGQIYRNAAETISRVDGDLLSAVLTDNLKSVMDAGLFDLIVGQIDNEKFKRLAVKMRFMHEKAGSGRSTSQMPDPDAFEAAFEQLMKSEKALSLQNGIQKKYELDLVRKKNQASRLKEGLNSIMKGEKYCFMDDQVMQSLPDTVEKLYLRGKNRTAEQIIGRLCEGLEDDDPEIRNASTRALTIINEEIRSLTGHARIQFENYLEMEAAPDLLKKKGLDRRTHERVDLSDPISIQIISGKGNPVGRPFKGNISGISAGGLSFYIKTSKTKTARLLLGRAIHLQFSLPVAAADKPLQKRGTVTGVKHHLHNDYSVHVKFDDLMDEKVMRKLQAR